MSVIYVCALPIKPRAGRIPQLFTEDPAAVAAFVSKWDRDGYGVYECANPLTAGATVRRLETVDAIDRVVVDIDFKDIVETAAEVDVRLAGLPLPMSELRDSGHGRHVVWNLRESIPNSTPEFSAACELWKKLARVLCGDPKVTNPHSLHRIVDTVNRKREPHVPCRVIHTGLPVDITELEALADLLADRELFTRKTKPASNGHAAPDMPQISGSVDVEARLAAMTYQGEGAAGVNATQAAVIPSLLRHGVHPDDVVEKVVDATMAMADTHNLKWSRDDEIKTVRGRTLSAIRNLLLKDYDHTTGVIPDWLPGEFHPTWIEVLQNGKRPDIGVNHRGFFVKGIEKRNDSKQAPPSPQEGTGKKYRFPLIAFNDMRPGSEQNYLIDELFPAAGLALVYGAPKSGKSFWIFDAVMHVSLGWEYRDRAVQQGPVIYCAFEGAHGYRKRSEAFRRHHCLTDEKPPLFIVPGRADLIRDHASLIRDMQGQLDDIGVAQPPKAVVLDTLNKSLTGSESKDVDMANYIAAAEAIQKAFGCLVVIVHHHGIEESRPRGHTSLRGAVDAQIKITRDEQNNIIAEIEDMRDGPEGAQIASRLVVVDVGQDLTGKHITSAAIEPVDAPLAKQKGPRLTPNQRTMLSLLEEAMPAGLTLNEWNAKARGAGLGKHRPATLADLRAELRRKGLTAERNGAWLVVSNQNRDL